MCQFVAALLVLTEHEVPSRFEADKSRAGSALSRALTRRVRGKLVIFGMGDQSGHADRLEVAVGDVGVGSEEVEGVALGIHGEQAVDKLGDVQDVIIGHGTLSRNRCH
jgi:hypothetical protein